MLIEFSVGNYLSFKDKVTLSMVASSDKSMPENVIESAQGTKLNLLKSAAIYGPNASGKSNFIKAISFMRWLINNSARGQVGDKIDVIPFKLDEAFDNKPSEFEITFLKDSTRYTYGFIADKKCIHEEWLYGYPKSSPRLLFERNLNKKEQFKFGYYWEGEKKILAKRTRENALFISVAAQLNNKLAKSILDWVSKHLLGVSPFPTISSEQLFTVMYSHKDPKFKQLVDTFLKNADVGIKYFKTKEISLFETKEWLETPEEVKNRILKGIPEGEKPGSIDFDFIHKGLDTKREEVEVIFKVIEESDGTQKIFSLAGPWIFVLEKGLTLIADELDVRLHPQLTTWLVSMFHDKNINKKGAQLIFATHDSGLLDQKLFRRDQIWFTEKNPNGATELYSLWDIKKPRKEENIRKGYLAGRYGAIPFLGEFEL